MGMHGTHEKERILARAVHAPSGDNSQPWHFKIDSDAIRVFNVGGRDATLYNFRERGSYLGHGALCENIRIIAQSTGLEAQIEPFPTADGCTARISFTDREPSTDPLDASIEKRTTNRKPYQKKDLIDADRLALASAFSFAGVRVALTPDNAAVARLATTVNLNEQLLFENRHLHDFLFGMIRWTTKEENEKPGLYVKTMEFPLPLQFLLKHVFRHWSVVQTLNKIGLSKGIPAQSAELYKSSSAFGAIIINSTANESFFTAGRALQRFWLTATSRGVSFQPVTAIPYLAQRIEAGEADQISSEHQALITAANAVISKEFSLTAGETVAMLFRIGYGDAPTATSAKLPPVIAS